MEFNIHDYDKYIVSFSGGKDSTACFLYLLKQGIPRHKIELWHQEIDGRDSTFFDWEITPDYCRKFAEAFGVKILFQWKKGGFFREMLRKNCRTAPNSFELLDGTIKTIGGKRGKISTRWKFPQLSFNLLTRWCSSYLKIGPCATAIRNDPRFNGIKTLLITGERGEESEKRKHYAVFEVEKSCDRRNGKSKRHVDHFRPIKYWTEKQVWEIIKEYRIRVHPCYYMGWNRCSCKFCIYGNPDQFKSAAYISPLLFKMLVRLEKMFGYTLKRDKDLPTLIQNGNVYNSITPQLKALATGNTYHLPIIFSDKEKWILPTGALKSCICKAA